MELLERFAKGELDAFETLFRQFQGEVYRWIIRIVRDPALAEDLTIETFWRIYRARARFDPTRSFQAWARRIASNLAASHLRNVRAEVALPENYPARPSPRLGNPARAARTYSKRLLQPAAKIPGGGHAGPHRGAPL